MSWGNTFPSCLHLFLRTFQQPNPYCCNRSTTNLFTISFLSRTIDFFFLSELMDLFVAGRDQSAADQPNNLAEGHPHCNHWNCVDQIWLAYMPADNMSWKATTSHEMPFEAYIVMTRYSTENGCHNYSQKWCAKHAKNMEYAQDTMVWRRDIDA